MQQCKKEEGKGISNGSSPFLTPKKKRGAEKKRGGQCSLSGYPDMLARSVDTDIERPVDIADDKEQRPDVLERCVDPGFFLLVISVPAPAVKECGQARWQTRTRTWSSRRAACAGVSPGSTLPPNPLYLRCHPQHVSTSR